MVVFLERRERMEENGDIFYEKCVGSLFLCVLPQLCYFELHLFPVCVYKKQMVSMVEEMLS